MKKFNPLLILGTTLLLSAAALTGCSGSSALGATTAQTTSGETTTPQTDAGIIASETTGSNNRLNDILERGYIEIATEPHFAPTKSGDDAYVGSDIELANYIGESLGVEVRIKPMDFTSVLGSITTGKYDLAISALAYTPARAETMNLSKGYYFGDEDPQTAYGILVRKEDVDSIKSFNDLADKVVVAQNGSLQEQFVQEQIPAYKKYNRVSSTNDGFLMVEAGKGDVIVAALRMARLYLESNPDSNLVIVPNLYFKVDPETQGTRIGIPKGEDALTDRINEIIDEVVEKDLYNQWYDEYTEYAKSLGIIE